MVALSMAAMELMVLAGCSCVFVWAFSLAVDHGFLQLTPISVSQDNSRCVASLHNMHFRGHSTSVVLRVCFIQQLIQDGIINAKQCPTAAQIADIGIKVLPRVPFESFAD